MVFARQRCLPQLRAVRAAAKGKRTKKKMKRLGKALAKFTRCKKDNRRNPSYSSTGKKRARRRR